MIFTIIILAPLEHAGSQHVIWIHRAMTLKYLMADSSANYFKINWNPVKVFCPLRPQSTVFTCHREGKFL